MCLGGAPSGKDHITWIKLENAEADDVIATVVHATTAPRPVIMIRLNTGLALSR